MSIGLTLVCLVLKFGEKLKMNSKKVKKMKYFAVTVAILMLTSILLTVNPVQAQVVDQGGENPSTPGGSIPLPAGVTPDLSYQTIAYISFRPNPIGVNQPLLINVWLEPPTHVARYFTKAFQVTLTKPDGTTDSELLTSYYGDTTSYMDYNVDQVGNWQIRLDFLGAYFPAGNYTSSAAFTLNQTLNAPQSVYYKPSTSGTFNFTVQPNVALSWPGAPLPTDYWSRPVNPLNREWWSILGNYPGVGVSSPPGNPTWPADTNLHVQSLYNFVPYVQGPSSCHIVWQQQTAISGMIGGTLYQLSNTGVSGTPNIIYAGRVYATYAKPGTGTTAVTYWKCYDLQTGQLYWERPLATGESAPTQIIYITRTISAVTGDTASQRNLGAALMYVGGGRIVTYDPSTGSVIWNVSISPFTSGTFISNDITAPDFLTIQTLGSGSNTQYRLINWTITGDIAYPDIINRRVGVISNVSFPSSSLGTMDLDAGVTVVSTAVNIPASVGVSYSYILTGVSLITGQVLWNVTTDASSGLGGFYNPSTACADHGLYAVRLNDGLYHAWNIRTGAVAWVSPLSSYPWGEFGGYDTSSAYGLLIYPQYDGVVAYNWTNGQIVWNCQYKAQYPYDNAFGETYPYDGACMIADGMVYVANTEHSPSQPVERGYALRCINASNGQVIWSILNTINQAAISDGYLIGMDIYNGMQYTYGKGLSSTTVTSSPAVTTQSNQVLIQGTVLDQSPAQPGTPCVSHESMETQMEYLHLQQSIQGVAGNATITGVPVLLTAIGSDGSVYNIGTTTTNGYFGTFAYAWTAPKVDSYTITASFAGDDSYGSSSAATGLSVGAAASTTPTPATPAPSNLATTTDLMTYIVVGVIAIIIAIALVGFVLYRKKQ